MIKIIKEILNFFLRIEFVRFGMVGVVNTMVDYGLMNLFLFTFNVERGIVFVIIKTFTISLAIAISYYLNRSWTFRDRHPSRLKFLKFIILSVILIVVNVSIAGLLFEYVEVGFDRRIWANLASLIGAIAAIIVKYFGAKRIFKNIEEK